MASAHRLKKSSGLNRLHIHMNSDWLAEIDEAADHENMSRSYFIAKAAYELAQKVNGKTNDKRKK